MSGAVLEAAVRAALPAWLAVHAKHHERPAVVARRRRWRAVMTAALPGFDCFDDGDDGDGDGLFVRHALLVATARGVARALGVEVAAGELDGALDWPERAQVEALAEQLAELDWDVDRDVLGPLYAALISAQERKGAGEHYTPDWLAARVLERAMRGDERVMDPSCGSGTFVFHAVRRALAVPGTTVEEVVARVRGMDVHPVAVVLARVNYLLALGAGRRGGRIDVPIRQGDAMRAAWSPVDLLIGNPPWLASRFMGAEMQARFRAQSEVYGLWSGGTVSTHQDLCGLFTVRTIEAFLAVGGRFAFVMPAAVLDRGQFINFRSGEYRGRVCVEFSGAWDLRRVRPHVFPVGAAVVFGARSAAAGAALTATEVWTRDASRGAAVATEAGARSPYHARFRQGATLVPRVLALVEREADGGVRSARSAHEKPPWRGLAGLRGEVEAEFLWPVVLGEHVLPFRCLRPALGVLPRDSAGWVEPDDRWPGLAAWWRTGEARWRDHRVSEKLTLRGQLDYQQKLAGQFPISPLRVVYTKSGMHLTAAKLAGGRTVVDHTLYWASVQSEDEADYLCALLNSAIVTRMVRPLMAYGKDERHIDKHVWRLPVPRFDPEDALHVALVRAARCAEVEVAGRALSGGWVAARRAIRGFLAGSAVGRELEGLAASLLATGAASARRSELR